MNYLHASTRLPLAIPLRDRPNPVDVFRQLEGLPKRLWLDSSTGWPLERALPGDELVRGLSRYSYVTADPIAVLNASHADPNPWNELERLANWLPTEVNEELPGFQGGLAGLIGYESARWLNDLELEGSFEHQIEDLPTPAMSFGVYDWVICFDHFSGNAWLVCQGVSRDDVIADKLPSLSIRLRQAYRRAEQIQKLLEQPADRTSPPISFCAEARGYPTPIELLRSDFTSEAYQRAVAEVVERIHAGDSFQVNIAQRLSCRFEGPSDELYRRLRDAYPAPFSAFYDGGEFQVLSSSPERFLSVADRVVQTRPIKGTTARTGNATRDGRL
ncbi:MAG: chorismate-binding protein, partial [Planctomycetota bacterium]